MYLLFMFSLQAKFSPWFTNKQKTVINYVNKLTLRLFIIIPRLLGLLIAVHPVTAIFHSKSKKKTTILITRNSEKHLWHYIYHQVRPALFKTSPNTTTILESLSRVSTFNRGINMISHSPPIFSHSPPVSFLADFMNNRQSIK